MFWASRTFSRDGWYPIQDQFEEDYDAAGMPADRMLCRVETTHGTTIYVGMPEPGLLDAYTGLDRCPQPGGTVRPLLLMGDQRAFDDIFHRRRPTRDRVD